MPAVVDSQPSGNPEVAAEVDPRVERSRRVILAAALDLLGEVGYGALTIEAVAARAGVGKSTIYRHWPGKLELIEDAIRALKCGLTAPPDGTVQQRVIALLDQVTCAFGDENWSRCLPAIIDAAERDPEVHAAHRRVLAERRRLLVDVLQTATERGEIGRGVDIGLLAESLVSPLIVRRVLLHELYRPDEIRTLVAQLLPALD